MRAMPTDDISLRQQIADLHPRVWRYCYVLTGQRDTAWDLSQSACARALEQLSKFDAGTRLDRWLMTLTHRVWLNQCRAENVRGGRQHVSLDSIDVEDAQMTAEMHVFTGQVLRVVMTLPETHRIAVLLVYVEGYSYNEAADMLGVAIGTIMSRLSTARALSPAR